MELGKAPKSEVSREMSDELYELLRVIKQQFLL